MAKYYPGNDIELGSVVGGDTLPPLTRRDRARHTYIVGASRTGKTKLLEGICRQDLISWPTDNCPMVVIDPHGTLYDGLMGYVAAEGLSEWPIIPFDLRRDDLIVSYNLLRHREGVDAAVICGGFVEAMLHAWGQANTNATPRLATWLETLLMLAYEKECTLTEALIAIGNPELRRILADNIQNLVARSTLESATHLTEAVFQERVESALYRINRFVTTQVLRATLCQSGDSLDLGRLLERGQILLACLSTQKTKVAEGDAAALGSVLLTDLWTAAKRRGKHEEGDVVPCYVHVDEFQNYISPTVAKGLSEASGFGLHLTLAHQYPSQLLDHGGEFGRMILNSVLANARNQIVFKLPHGEDLELMASMLYRQAIDPYKVKDEIWQTKVVGQKIVYLPSYTDSIADGVANSETHTHNKTHGHMVGTNWQKGQSKGNALTVNDGITEADSDGIAALTGAAHADTTSAGDIEQKGKHNSITEGDAGGNNWSVTQTGGNKTPSDFDASNIAPRSVNDSVPTVQNLPAGVSVNHGGNDANTLLQAAGESNVKGHTRGRATTDTENQSVTKTRTSQLAQSHQVGATINTTDTASEGGNEAVTDQISDGIAQGVQISTVHTKGVSLSPVVLSIMDKELSSRQFESIEEQLHRATQLIEGQPDRHGVVRLASMATPVQIYTRTIDSPLTTPEYTAKWVDRTLAKLPFTLTMEQAIIRMDQRMAGLHHRFANKTGNEEPTTARRKVKKQSPPQSPT